MEEGSYRRSIGQLELVSPVIGGTKGSGIFVVPGIAAGILGPASLKVWGIVVVVIIFFYSLSTSYYLN